MLSWSCAVGTCRKLLSVLKSLEDRARRCVVYSPGETTKVMCGWHLTLEIVEVLRLGRYLDMTCCRVRDKEKKILY